MSESAAPVGVTGATGRLGSRVAQRLAMAGVRQRLLVRDLTRAPLLPGAEVVRGSFGEPGAVREGLAGIPVVLMVSASGSQTRVAQHRTFAEAAAAAGVRHLVYVSFLGAAPDCTFTHGREHYATEQHIRSLGLDFTFLRDNFYADLLPSFAGADGVIRGPAGSGRVSAVAEDDVADAVTAILLDPPRHAGATYSLTGPEALSLEAVATTLSRELQRPVRYVEESVEEAYASRAGLGAPDWQVQAWVSTYTAIANGELSAVTDDVRQLTGHPATTLAELLRSGRSAY
ncbi:MAG: SDR family oxidoreductase [Streptosporangiaceae bacterium]